MTLGGGLLTKTANGNHSYFELHAGVTCAKIVQDVVKERALAFEYSSVSDISGLRVSPLGAVQERMLCIIHNLTFAGDGYSSSVNDDTDLSSAPPCELSHVFGD